MRGRLRRSARVAGTVAGLTAVVLLAVSAFWREPRMLTLTVDEVRTPAWPSGVGDLRVVLLSDVHVDRTHMRPERVAAVVRAADALQPDVILLAGDYVGGHLPERSRRTTSPLLWSDAPNATVLSGLRALGGLRARYGVFAVMGNHDSYWNSAKAAEVLGAEGIHVLQNASAVVQRPSGPVWIVGIADAGTQRPDFAKATLGVPPSAAIVGLTHNPVVFDWRADRLPVMLAGHTHGGQVRAPWLGAFVGVTPHANDAFARPLVRDDRVLVVSRGLGESGLLPIRFGAAPEILLITLGHGDQVRVRGPD